LILPLSLLVIGLLAGCPDAKSRFEQFENRVIDAASATVDAGPCDEIPDINGSFYVVYAPKPTPDNPIHTIWDVTFTRNGDGTANIDILSTPLAIDTRKKVLKLADGTDTPFKMMNIKISTTCEFQVAADGMPLPASANVLATDLFVNMKLAMTIKNENAFCGTMTEGKVVTPNVDLAGTKLGAQRIPPGTDGAALPPPLTDCPADLPDAGVPDAGPPDATIDATIADAAIDA
jgi:hypothetical protein